MLCVHCSSCYIYKVHPRQSTHARTFRVLGGPEMLCQFESPYLSPRSLPARAVHGSARHPPAATHVYPGLCLGEASWKGLLPFYVGKEPAVRHTPTYCLRPFVLTWLCSKNSTNRPSSWRPELLAGESGGWI